MKIWVDADACPIPIKEILCRAANRTATAMTFVANHQIDLPASHHVNFLHVSQGFDVADDAIVKRMQSGDLVITSDIPLAAEVIEKGGHALNSRGERYTESNIKQRLQMRDFMETMRSSGVQMGGGPAPLNNGDKQAFANHLDRFLAKYVS